MAAGARFRWIKLGLIAVMFVALSIWCFFRPPAATAGSQVIDVVDLTGQIRGTVANTVQAVRQLATIDGETSDDIVTRRRETVNGFVAACQRMRSLVKASDSDWLPVAEAVVLLTKTEEFAAIGLAKAPTRQVTSEKAAGVESLETDPDKTGMTRESVEIIESRAKDLLNDSQRLFTAVSQSAMRAAFTRATWMGLEARDYLLACVLVSVVVGLLVTWQAQVRWATSPTQALESELRLLAHSEPRAAIAGCYTQSTELLKLADVFLLQANPEREGMDVKPATSAQ